MPRSKHKASSTPTEEAEVDHILDERGRPSDDETNESNAQSRRNSKRIKKKKKETNHQFLIAWSDGADPQWVDAVHLENTPALEEWREAEDEEPEFVDSPSDLDRKLTCLTEWLSSAKRPVFLLGAGISASVLPTFRGKNGLWTKNARKNELADAKVSDGIRPTLAHRALAALERGGYVYYVATQNYDDLSHRSGFPDSKLSELHGNIFTETCSKCGRKYRRDFEVALESAVEHETGRHCDDCGGVLKDSIIHFEEALPWHALKMANAKFVGSDLTIVLGSSLKVEPAASLPFKGKRRRRSSVDRPRACIVNLQKTPFDDDADLLIRSTCDSVMDHVAKTLLGETWDENKEKGRKDQPIDPS